LGPPVSGLFFHQSGDVLELVELRVGNRRKALSDEKVTRERAEAIFRKQEQQRAKAAAESEAEAQAIREKTARLKALRQAKEATEEPADRQPSDRAIGVDQLNASNDD
jgi:hypothetical protein